jgi:hypothetical protein
MIRAVLLLLALLAAGCVKDDYRRWERHCIAHKL